MKLPLTLACVSLACTLQGAGDSFLKLVQTIPMPGVKGRFDHFSIDTQGQRLFVAALGNNALEVIDLAAGKRAQTIHGMSKPTGVLYLPELNQVIIANGDDGTLKILRGADFQLVHTLASVPDADNLRLDPKSKTAWLGYGDGALGLIDFAAPKLLASIKLSAHPESFRVERSGRRIFVNVPGAKQIAVIDVEKQMLTQTWPMEKFQDNFPMALDERNHRLFVGCRKPPRLVVLDSSSGKCVADLPVSGDTDDLFYDSNRKRIYISCGEGFFDVIEQTTADKYNVLSKLPTAPGARTSFFSSELDRLYLAVPNRANQRAEIRVFQPQ